MDILPVNFKFLQFCGAWKENEDRHFIVRVLRYFYRYALVGLIYHFTVCEIVELLISGDIEDLIECLFMTLTYVTLCFKYGNFLLRKREILILVNLFRDAMCQYKNSTEKDIIDKYNRKAEQCAIMYMILSQSTGLALVMRPVMSFKSPERYLPLKMYLPYSVGGLLPFVATYIQQFAVLVFGILLNVSFDSLVYSLIIRTCGQVELLRYRLIRIFKNTEENHSLKHRRNLMLRMCINHHVLINEFVYRIQSLFVWIITCLFFFSLVTLCTSIFRLSKVSILSLEFLSLLMYTSCMLVQILFYCWYGTELHLKSKHIGEAVYFSNWTAATPQERKNILLLMRISQKGLNLSFHGTSTLAINTFTWIMKTSYSAFNLLQRMSY